MTGPGTTLALPSTTGTCLDCGMADRPPSMRCTLGRDHRVGTGPGCPACLRLMTACAARPFVAAHGDQFHPDYSPVLRAMLFAADRHSARTLIGVMTEPAEAVR